jgi:tetratricopeptide (TPR) repeat protein
MIELDINFPVNVTEVRPSYMNNPAELRRADSLVVLLSGNELININGINIRGYASPEGRYANNERLAKGRSEGFKCYLINKYPHIDHIRNATTMWTAEDWEGLALLVEQSDLPNKQEVLAVVLDGSMAPDTKEQVLQKIGKWSEVYKPMLDEMFPKLRRIELRVDYTVQNLSDAQARELLYTNPDMLSLEEIYRVARFYQPSDVQYRKVYEIAVSQYPDDVIANNNAAAAFLREGDAESALPYLQKIEGNPASYINYGAYYYMTGDAAKAIEYFNMAKGAGAEQADHNLRLIKAAN